jgi:hypothetical protein
MGAFGQVRSTRVAFIRLIRSNSRPWQCNSLKQEWFDLIRIEPKDWKIRASSEHNAHHAAAAEIGVLPAR